MTHDDGRHQDLVAILAKTGYPAAYLDSRAKCTVGVGIDGPHIDMAGLSTIFHSLGVKTKLHKRFRTFEFDHETVAGWEWHASLVIQRYDMLEPMMEGHKGESGVGSTFLSLAVNADTLTIPPVSRPSFKITLLENPPVHLDVPYPRPQFDGDMRTMARMVPDLVALFRSVKVSIGQNW